MLAMKKTCMLCGSQEQTPYISAVHQLVRPAPRYGHSDLIQPLSAYVRTVYSMPLLPRVSMFKAVQPTTFDLSKLPIFQPS